MEISAVTDTAEVFAWHLRTDQTDACRPRGGILTLVSPWSQRQGVCDSSYLQSLCKVPFWKPKLCSNEF